MVSEKLFQNFNFQFAKKTNKFQLAKTQFSKTYQRCFGIGEISLSFINSFWCGSGAFLQMIKIAINLAV